jgi:DNA-binding NarL/FixJ family response regulator
MRKTTILLADDHKLVRDGLNLVINGGEFDVIGMAEDGIEAVQKVRDLKPDMVVMDISMPRLNGIEACHQIRSFDPQVKLLILTGYSHLEYIRRCLQARVNGYVLKTSGFTTLMEALQTLARGEPYFSPEILADIEANNLTAEIAPSAFDLLTAREREVFFSILDGRTSKEAAEQLSLSPKTVETYRSRIFTKMGLSSVADLTKFAISKGLISVD